jgi:hypothetical protein
MRKIYTIMVVLLLVLMGFFVFSPPATAHTEAEPKEVALIADGGDGSGIIAGHVYIWNDVSNIYVKYETTGDWVITATHLDIAKTGLKLQQNKNGNPKPGKFAWGEPFDPGVTSITYTINLAENGLEIGDGIKIAAHADLERPIDGCWETVWQIGDVETTACNGLLTNYANEFNWVDKDDSGAWTVPIGDCVAGPSLAVYEPPFTNPFIIGTTPTNEFPYNSNNNRGYATNFDVQWSGALPYGGKLTISWSPGQSATETKIVSSGDGITATTLTAKGEYSPGKGYFLDKYPLVEHTVDVDPITDGTHTINFKHTAGDGTFWDWVRLEKPCVQQETGWGEGEDFPGKNWAMYIEYDIQDHDPILVDTVIVNSNNINGANSITLTSQKEYLFKASGTWQDNSQDYHYIDAEYTTFDNWDTHMQGTYNWGPNQKDIQLDSTFIDWGPFDGDTHEYCYYYTGTGSMVNFRVFDGKANQGDPPVPEAGWYGDNVGSITIEIYEMP